MEAVLSHNTNQGYSWGKRYVISMIAGAVVAAGVSFKYFPQDTVGSQLGLAATAVIAGASIGMKGCFITGTLGMQRIR